jgi:hypothetical protein
LAAGDVDNDGDDELVVGTTTYLNRSADKAMLFLEPEEGMDYDHPDTSWQHATAGIKVFPKVVPDMNGDGHAEVLLTFDGWRRPGAFLQDDVSDGLFIVDPTRRGPVHLETEGVLVEPRGDIDRLNYAASVVVDANGDGAITRQELADTVLRMFSRADRDGDGRARPPEQPGRADWECAGRAAQRRRLRGQRRNLLPDRGRWHPPGPAGYPGQDRPACCPCRCRATTGRQSS